MKHQNNDYAPKREARETNPWMYVSFFLGVLLVASFISNIYVISKTSGGSTNTGGAQLAPTVQAPSAQQPAAPAARVAVSADDDPVIGDKNAPVTIIEFSDFQCPFCKRFHDATWPQLKTDYIDTGKAKLVYRDFPLGFHQNAQVAAEAAECADDQGKFWEMHEIIFKNSQSDGTGIGSADLKKYAGDLKLDMAKFNSCLDSGKYKDEVAKDTADGSAAGVSGTPSFFVNGQMLVGAQPYEVFKQTIDAELAK